MLQARHLPLVERGVLRSEMRFIRLSESGKHHAFARSVAHAVARTRTRALKHLTHQRRLQDMPHNVPVLSPNSEASFSRRVSQCVLVSPEFRKLLASAQNGQEKLMADVKNADECLKIPM